MTTTFKLNMLLDTTQTYKMALYTEDADLGPGVTAYTTDNEVSGTGYTAGGMALTIAAGSPSVVGTSAYLTFENPVWTTATIAARGAVIYQDTAGNPSVGVMDFGAVFSVTGANFEVDVPADVVQVV
jgi:hypothetical protein